MAKLLILIYFMLCLLLNGIFAMSKGAESRIAFEMLPKSGAAENGIMNLTCSFNTRRIKFDYMTIKLPSGIQFTYSTTGESWSYTANGSESPIAWTTKKVSHKGFKLKIEFNDYAPVQMFMSFKATRKHEGTAKCFVKTQYSSAFRTYPQKFHTTLNIKVIKSPKLIHANVLPAVTVEGSILTLSCIINRADSKDQPQAIGIPQKSLVNSSTIALPNGYHQMMWKFRATYLFDGAKIGCSFAGASSFSKPNIKYGPKKLTVKPKEIKSGGIVVCSALGNPRPSVLLRITNNQNSSLEAKGNGSATMPIADSLKIGNFSLFCEARNEINETKLNYTFTLTESPWRYKTFIAYGVIGFVTIVISITGMVIYFKKKIIVWEEKRNNPTSVYDTFSSSETNWKNF